MNETDLLSSKIPSFDSLEEDLVLKYRTVDAVLSDLVFIVENSQNNLWLRNYVKYLIIPTLGHTLYVDKKVDRKAVMKVAAQLHALSIYEKTGTMPDEIEELTDPLACLSPNNSASTQLTSLQNTTESAKTFTDILTDFRLLLKEK